MKFGIREIVFVVLLTGLPVSAWWLAFHPQNERASEMRRQIDLKQDRLRDLNRATATIGNLRERIRRLEEAMDYFHSKLPSEKEIDKVLQEVWRMAETNQLRTKSIRTLQRSAVPLAGSTKSCSEQPISVALEGNFLGFYAFLTAMEGQPRIMRIQKMTLKKLAKGPEGDLDAEFNMTIFFEGLQKDRS